MNLKYCNAFRPQWLIWSLCILLFTANSVYAQKKTVVFSSDKMTVNEMMEEIKSQTGYRFAFDRIYFNTNKTIEPGQGEMSLTDALTKLVEGQSVDYIIRNNIIAITLKKETQSKQPAIPKRTSDVYKRTPVNAISPAPVTRPEAADRPVTVQAADEPEEVPEQRTFPEYSVYTPINAYGHGSLALPRFAVKTNLLYAAAMTPNLAFEFAVGKRSTIELSGSYTWYGREKKDVKDYKQFVHMILRPEYRYWLCDRFNGHFFGVHAIYARYNTSGYTVPLLFDKEYRYDGNAFGAGLTYGYNWAFAKRWGLEFNIGLGYVRLKYDKFDCHTCARQSEPKTKNYFGPTRAGITMMFMFK